MEKLLHYTWQHKLYPLATLTTTHGETVEIIDPGLHNTNAGPDFFNAKLKIGNTLWVGNVEIHDRSSDWFRHHHETDSAYNNVILHVAETIDTEVTTQDGRTLPQLSLSVPAKVQQNYEELLSEEKYPPCYRVIPSVNTLLVHSWLSALVTERLENKTERIHRIISASAGDWERACFVTLARNFGFGVNSDTFEQWALQFPLSAAGKHRDNLFQLEALFFGQAGLLDTATMNEKQRQAVATDDYFQKLQKEYAFLAHKFSLQPIDGKLWRFLRLRPQNFPHIRIAQLIDLYYRGTASFSKLLEAETPEQMRACLSASAGGYWETHYRFGVETERETKHLQAASIDLLLINTLAPLLFAYGRHRMDEELCERAFHLLESLKPEQNFIIRSWRLAGLKVETAADSQALIELRRNYCDPKDCLRCRFGYEYLKKTDEK